MGGSRTHGGWLEVVVLVRRAACVFCVSSGVLQGMEGRVSRRLRAGHVGVENKGGCWGVGGMRQVVEWLLLLFLKLADSIVLEGATGAVARL